MHNRRDWIAMMVVILSAIMFIPVAQAQRQDFEIMQCNSATANVVHSTPELGLSTVDSKGIIQSTHENKLFDNWSRHSVFLIKRIGGNMTYNGVVKQVAPDGDFIVWEYYGDGKSGSTAKAIYGTGKWKDVKGVFKGQRVTKGKPIAPATDQFCEKAVGWIEVPK